MNTLSVLTKTQKSYFQKAYLSSFPYNLVKSGNLEKYYKILTNFTFIETKINHLEFGVQALIEDYDLINNTELLNNPEYNAETVKALKLIQGALRLSTHVLYQDAMQLAGQLTGRLLSFGMPEIQALLEQIVQTKTICLRPLTPSLTPPGGALVRTLNGHSGSVNAVTVTTDGQKLISGSSDNSLKVWNLETGEEIFSLIGHNASVTAVAATFDGKLVISGSDDKTLKVWDLETGEERFTFSGHRNCINAISISRKSQQVVSASSDNIINVWNLKTGEKQFSINGHNSPVQSLALTSNDKLLVSGSYDSIIKVWNLETGQEMLSFKGHSSAIRTVFISPDDNQVISASSNNNLRCWSLQTGKQLFSSSNQNDWVKTVTVTPDMSTAISGLSDNALKVWNIKTGKTIFTTSNHNDSIKAVVVTPDGKKFISVFSNHTIKIWNLEIVDESVITYAHSASINAVAIIPNSKQVISASSDSTLKVWNIETGKENFTLSGHTDSVNGVAINRDGKQAISVSSDNTIKVWELATNQNIFNFFRNSKKQKKILNLTSYNHVLTLTDLNKVTAVSISGDGKSLISASSDNILKLWNLTSGKKLFTLSATPKSENKFNLQKANYFVIWYLRTGEKIILKRIDDLAFTSDNKFQISVGKYSIIVSDNSRKIQICNLPIIGCNKTCFLSNLGLLYTYKYYNNFWEITIATMLNQSMFLCNVLYLETNQKLTFYQWNSFLITENDKWAVLAAINKLIVIEISTGNETFILNFEHYMDTLFLNDSGKLYVSKPEKYHDTDGISLTTESINAVAFSPNSLQVASGSSHRALRVWDLSSKEILLTIRGHKKSINAVAFSSDGLQVISASSDHTIKAWDVKSQIQQFSLTGHKDSVNAFAISYCGKYLISASSDTTLKVWDLQSFKEIVSFTGESSMNCCAIAPDGTTIVAGEASGRLHFLRLEGTEVEL